MFVKIDVADVNQFTNPWNAWSRFAFATYWHFSWQTLRNAR